ncbi:CpsD/CapB family tyrosine-protein kinase [Companilactobacillus ginsenosidimutans]|uniref:Tyrosine-protein kinase CpsD n=1 Tax=Companilactobacillus ginsenosidimutans TaxID=1007676 RepID=A0A0H4QG74_9LACO|nr:CpsD/CapB family tyrosine-protein kinase [Companilactobacillus ginsenosidimutans]AKP67399.1 exopolysaccharide biosynthesis protein [Companilactobacillus ginsenosidimutans]
MFGNFRKNKRKKLNDYSLTHGVGLITHDSPTSMISEQFNTIRTNIQFSSVDEELTSILFTSSAPSEGKSTVSNNVAVSWAKQGERVILIDADLRRPTIHKTFNVSNQTGLSNYLFGSADFEDIIQKTMIPNLFIITSGPIPPNPSELLGSKRIPQLLSDLKENFSLTIFDAPPVNLVTDAQILASKVDGVILVIPQGIADKAQVINAKKSLLTVRARILGGIMNRSKCDNADGYYGGYYGIEK